MDFTSIAARLEQQLPKAIARAVTDAVDPWVEVQPEQWLEVAQFLRHDTLFGFNYLNCISGVDYLQTDPKKIGKSNWQPHLELVYHLSNLRLKHRLVVKLTLPRWKDDVEGELPYVPSVAGVWPTADWHEREVYDLVGVRFTGHPNLRRILCAEDWVGHPLRKDYEMPLEYHGIRGR